MIRKQIFVLYRTKLRLCKYMGYKYGTFDKHMKINAIHRTISLNYIHQLMHTNLLGTFVWNNVRKQYKERLYETDSAIINDEIDEAFVSLKYINYLTSVYKEQQKLLPR